MAEVNLKIEQYEGPLDLLLALISKHKIDIFDIPIAEICDQYNVSGFPTILVITPKGDGDVPLGDRVNMKYMTSNVVYGKNTGATPDGRRDGEMLKFGIGQSAGYDREGLTALLCIDYRTCADLHIGIFFATSCQELKNVL